MGIIRPCKVSFADEKIKKAWEKLDKEDELENFGKTTSYFGFIFNEPSKFYKMDYAINKIWRKEMIKGNIKKIGLDEIKDKDTLLQ